MPLLFVRLIISYKTDLIAEYFERLKDAESNRETEFRAAIQIQRIWRGAIVRSRKAKLEYKLLTKNDYLFRKWQKIMEIERQRQIRENTYGKYAVLIQKMYWDINGRWRGYRSRKYVFDFYVRQANIQQIMKRMDKMRIFVEEKNEYIMEQRQITEEEKRLEKIDRYARNHHHLLGTKNVPGVPLMNNFLPSILKDNSGIRECLAKIGRNPRKIRIKPLEIAPHSPKDREKKSQGPFLKPTFIANKKLQRKKFEKPLLLDVTCSNVVKRKPEVYDKKYQAWSEMTSMLCNEPYTPIDNRNNGFEQPKDKPRMRTVLPQLVTFDELYY
ncbi:spermatogenesis-associated protein 17 [Boothiomyces sp. JEL0866]|nr:spermatogenesis-associated protein 17 [Boothiomyces sp. JEL0866]